MCVVLFGCLFAKMFVSLVLFGRQLILSSSSSSSTRKRSSLFGRQQHMPCYTYVYQ